MSHDTHAINATDADSSLDPQFNAGPPVLSPTAYVFIAIVCVAIVVGAVVGVVLGIGPPEP